MSDPAPPTAARHDDGGQGRWSLRPIRSRRQPWWLLLGVVAGLLALIALVFAGFRMLAAPQPTAGVVELVPQSELDRRWGSYLSEREWGTPREAIDGNGWGLSWSEAISTDYRYSDDGIAGVTDTNNEFRLAWAFWDGTAPHVTERFNGHTNPGGPAGEEITEDRVFAENGPTHAYHRLTYQYPSDMPWFSIELESARLDSSTMTLVATVTNTTEETRTLNVVFRAWQAPGHEIEPLNDGLLLTGSDSVVAVVGQTPSEWQISGEKGALDQNLRGDGLAGDGGGNNGSLAYRLEIPAGSASVIRVAAAEAFKEAEFEEAAVATRAASDALARSDEIVTARRDEAAGLFAGQVTEHEPLYRHALMNVSWNESFYRWDGTSSVNPAWSGRVDAHDILIMPDKWEFPWLASWDLAFHAVTASLIDPELAADQLRFMLSDRWQQPDGHIPCGEWVMNDECPPVLAWAAWRIFERTHDAEYLAEVYPGLKANYDYWWTTKMVGDSLFSAGFLGMDNLPRGGPGVAQADATAWMAFFARDMARIASELDDHTASERYWVDRGHIQEQINIHLWDPETQFYYDLTPRGRFLAQKSYTGLIPLIAGVVPPERLPSILDALRDENQFLSAGGIRSVSAASPLYKPGVAGRGANSNWLGPVWVPINYLLIESLADVDPSLANELRVRVVGAVEADWQATGRLHEFFDGDTGAGLGADGQAGWTALVANLISEGWPAPAAP